ncbi:MAG TPA: DUF3619 family protein [Burkholderiaceae bacterium]|nr:DUF3619 family protein [Burkholderiaceae bacterium]
MNETEFGYRIRQALNEGLDRLDYRTTYRLGKAREAALTRHHSAETERVWMPALQPAGGPDLDEPRAGRWQWLVVLVPLLAVAIGFVGIYQYQDSRRISEIADIDFAVLLDDVPLSTYADKGFGALLKTSTTETDEAE